MTCIGAGGQRQPISVARFASGRSIRISIVLAATFACLAPATVSGQALTISPVTLQLFTQPAGVELTPNKLAIPDLVAWSLGGPGWQTDKLLPCVVWAHDGKSFYTLDSTGVVRQISADGKTQLASMNLPVPADWLTLSAKGPVVTCGDPKTACLLTGDLSKMVLKLPLPPKMNRVVSSPGSTIALGGSTKGGDVSVLDLRRGSVLGQAPKVSFGHAKLSPDGNHLYTQGGIEQLQRYRINGSEIKLEDQTPRIAQNGQSIAVSPDGKYVSLPSGGGNYQFAANHPKSAAYSTYVYDSMNLKKPLFAVPSGAYPRAMAFDPAGKRIIAQNAQKDLMLFDFKGQKQKEYSLSPGGVDDVRQFAMHPEGLYVLVLTRNQLYLVTLRD